MWYQINFYFFVSLTYSLKSGADGFGLEKDQWPFLPAAVGTQLRHVNNQLLLPILLFHSCPQKG